ncbi:carbon monoxide dehydrogenase [Thermopolyspora flexuosa]|uniref:CO/xanthine dehydrogenase FAD-binding subunit n=1 Tax=Thermopolyspora flexuosa TaxID=103836 RepID=A0A543ISE8_9ACTN|nr:FAD binding domain-containing protein [Thermopolyspora flexuosa]TQM73506.1 CO/xanthine dehydrogenase FAD-binding subunit [Thermopolyspora flexuosa]GGM81735.1 carbon monoxide dehydrogenase [Thermopolyspora flexuosa]
MITNNFGYHAPPDLDGVVAALAEARGDVVVLGGGTMIIPDLTHGRASADVVVDLSRAGLSGIREEGDEVVVGATTTYTEVLSDDRAAALVPLLRTLSSGITGGPQIRNKGTIGGSAAYANPCSDVPACLVALGARMRLASARGVREVPAEEFYTGAFATVRRRDEVLAAIVLPRPDGTAGYTKLKLAESSWPIVTAAVVSRPDGSLRVAIGAVAETPRLIDVEPPSAGVDDPAWRDHVRRAVAAAVPEPWSDLLADGAYRMRVAPAIVARSVAKALAAGGEETP